MMLILLGAIGIPDASAVADDDYYLVLRQNLVAIDIIDFLQPTATLCWYEGITILAVLPFQSLAQWSMQFGS
jgi:hypothetical protein